MKNEVIIYKILANVNPLEPNCMEVVDSSSGNCCSDDYYLNTLVPKRVAELREKGFRVRVLKSVLSYLDI